MPRRKDINKVMVIGSGPIIIGQAAEFDYAGTQACRALMEEGIEVVLVNSNPATIMTDTNMADRVYIEPLTWEFVAKIIAREKPDGLLATLGGQVGLNLAIQLAKKGVLEREGVRLLGTPLEAIEKAEDRELFKDMMLAIGEPVPESRIVNAVDGAVEFAQRIGYPVIVRPAYTLGGTGGGVAGSEDELREIATRGLKYSIIEQVLIEQSVAGWKEVEYEVMRDAADNCITICNMENIDPVGIHTGDSIVVAPSQTLSDREYQMLRSASIRIIRALGIEGGCNIQFALDPLSFRYYVIEVNPRVSRSSALASKATGYPIAKVAAKIALGYTLGEIQNAVTGQTFACFEPALDYVVVKLPRWPFDKFAFANRTLGTQMKATGEVMAIDRSFGSALLKAIRSLETGLSGLQVPGLASIPADQLEAGLTDANDERLFITAEAFRRGLTVDQVADLTRIDRFFLEKIAELVRMETRIETLGLPPNLLREAKGLGYSDRHLAALSNRSETEIDNLRREHGIRPVYKMVDTCAAEFEAETPYFYSTYDTEDEAVVDPVRKVIVLGSGPIRIGQGIEFDYCSVHSSWALREAGIQSIIINNNPETVSTDFDTSDRLYFEPLLPEDVLNIIAKERPEGVIVQFGGQTAINLAGPLSRAGVRVLGTDVNDIDAAEDRDRFDRLLADLGVDRPPGKTATSVDDAVAVAANIGFPVLVRPSYVLGGRAMEIVYQIEDLRAYMEWALEVSPDHPVLIDKYLAGTELEVDAVCDGQNVLIPGIMEHIERAGVHSGDSIAVYPAHSLPQTALDKVVEITTKLACALRVKGIINIQFVLFENRVYVLEVNPRASRTVPYISKVTGIPLVKLATHVILGKSLPELGYEGGLVTPPSFTAVKVPVFSFAKLLDVDTSLGPEMKSTGEVMGIDPDYSTALYKAMVASGSVVPVEGTILATIADKDKEEALPILRGFASLGFTILATAGTEKFLSHAGLKVGKVNKVEEGPPTIVDLIRGGRINLVINTLTRGKQPERDGFRIRRAAAEHGVPCLTSLDTACALYQVLQLIKRGEEVSVRSLQEYVGEQSGPAPRYRF